MCTPRCAGESLWWQRRRWAPGRITWASKPNLTRNGDVWGIDMPYMSDRPVSVRYTRTVEKLQLMEKIQTNLAKLAGLRTRQEHGAFEGAHIIGLSYSAIARRMNERDKSVFWHETKRLKTLLDTNDQATYLDQARRAIAQMQQQNSPHEQRRAAKWANGFVERACAFLNTTQKESPDAAIALTAQLPHFAPLAYKLESEGYVEEAVNWLQCVHTDMK